MQCNAAITLSFLVFSFFLSFLPIFFFFFFFFLNSSRPAASEKGGGKSKAG